jgi:hypothetical protein
MLGRAINRWWVLTGIVLLSAGFLRADDASDRLTALDRAIMLRSATDGKIYGANEIDPLLWSASTHLLDGDPKKRLIVALESVLSLTDAELRRCPPIQRALVQNRVWTLFDYVKLRRPDHDYLQMLVRVIAKLALDQDEIATIADPLAEAEKSDQWPSKPSENGGPDIFLPLGIAAKDGPWINLVRDDGELTARLHTVDFGGRTWFLIRASFPEGGTAVESYFKQVAAVTIAGVQDGHGNTALSPALPVLPTNAEFALVRKLAVIDRGGHWQATPLTLTVQVRRYRITDRATVEKMTPVTRLHDQEIYKQVQNFSEFRLETATVAAGQTPKMRAVQPDEAGFLFFRSIGNDQVDDTTKSIASSYKPGPTDVPMQGCYICHASRGLEQLGLGSINALTFTGPTSDGLPLLIPAAPDREAKATESWKSKQSDWSELQRLWPEAQGGPTGR